MVTGVLSFIPQVFVLLVWIAGIAVAIIRWKQHPRVSLFTVAALSAFAIETVFGSALTLTMPLLMQTYGLRVSEFGIILFGWNAVRSVVSALAWILVLIAIFSERAKQ